MPQHVKSDAWVRQFQIHEEYMAAVGFAHRQMHGQVNDGFHATLAQLDLGAIKLRLGHSSHGATVIGPVPDAHAFMLATWATVPSRTVCGRDLPADALCHHRPNELFHSTTRSGAPWPWASIWMRYEELEQSGSALAGRDVSPSRSDLTITAVPEPARERLLRLMADAGRLAAASPEVAASPCASHALSGAVLEALVGCLAQGDMKPDRAAARRRHQIMARLDRVLEEHDEETLTLPQLCTAVGVAERTLHLVCQEFVGLGPMQYWRSLRLNRVRQDLLAADHTKHRVAEIAMRHGFWELGRFAGAYRATFGELPSATLSRNGP